MTRNKMTLESPDVWLVSDRADWLQSARSAVEKVAPLARFAYCRWRGLSSFGDLSVEPALVPRLMCWDLTAAEHANYLKMHANRFYQYSSVVYLAVDSEQRESLACRVSELGYRQLVIGNEGNWAAFGLAVGKVLGSSAHLVPAVASILAIRTRKLAHSIAIVLEDATAVRTVDGWGRTLGYSDRHAIEALYREEDLPRPWVVLASLRLLAAVDWASRQTPMLNVSQVAGHFKYCSGNYLNTHAERLAGMRFGDLMELGSKATVQLIGERLHAN